MSGIGEEDKGLLLDIGCGEGKQPGFIGMDKRDVSGVDIVHDLEVFPYPIGDNECHIVIASHILEHIKPWLTIDLFNEVWRIMKPGGKFVIAVPYAGSQPFWIDPTHCNGFIEDTFAYFDVRHQLWGIYKPKPWMIEDGFPTWQTSGIIEVVMRKATGEGGNG